ncbi:10752_t:CDS:1, partial [Ambispora gerdemannii]
MVSSFPIVAKTTVGGLTGSLVSENGLTSNEDRVDVGGANIGLKGGAP